VPILTALAPDPRQPGYQVLHVDRGRFASLPASALTDLSLAVGQELEPRVLDRLRDLADVEAAYRAAVRAQARRAHARGDLARRLVRKQHPSAAVDLALARLVAQGLLDDDRFARDYAASRATRGRGPARLLRDLLSQGVDRRLAEAAVRQALADEGVDPAVAVRSVAEKRASRLAGLPRPVQRRRLLAFLLRRGYAGAAVRDLVEELCGT
jgi:regulatory protein